MRGDKKFTTFAVAEHGKKCACCDVLAGPAVHLAAAVAHPAAAMEAVVLQAATVVPLAEAAVHPVAAAVLRAAVVPAVRLQVVMAQRGSWFGRCVSRISKPDLGAYVYSGKMGYGDVRKVKIVFHYAILNKTHALSGLKLPVNSEELSTELGKVALSKIPKQNPVYIIIAIMFSIVRDIVCLYT